MAEAALQEIVVGTDFNELATAALRFTAAIARKSGAQLTVVYADLFDGPIEFTSSQVGTVAAAAEATKRETVALLERYVKQHAAGANTATIVAQGHPVETLTSIAEHRGSACVAVGTHGRGGLQRILLGSVAESLIQRASVPVLTVRTLDIPIALRRILVPLACSDSPALTTALQFARATGAAIGILPLAADVRVEPPPDVAVEVLAPPQPGSDALVAILGEDASRKWDLIVVASEHHLSGERTPFGTSVTSVIRHATTPVLTVRSART